MNIKICDFGLAAKLEYDNQRRTTFCGTPNYIAPEILQKKQYHGHSYEVDIWSLGVLLYSLLCGKPPFETSKIKDTYERIKQLKYRFPYNNQLSGSCKDIITLILKNEPSERLTLDFMLIHNFLNGKCPMPESIPVLARFTAPTKKQLFPNGIKHGRHSKQASDSTLKTIINHNYAGNYDQRNENKTEEPVGRDIGKISQLLKSMAISNKNTTNFMLYIIDWIDYRKRYGIGYILSNGYTGIYFNDSTKILSKPGSVLYIDMNGNGKSFGKKHFPAQLMKKMTLLMHFESYLKSKLTVEQNEAIRNYQSLHMCGYGGDGNGMDVYLNVLTSTSYAKVFVLSNNDVQIDFNDGSRIITCMEKRLVVYTNKEQIQQHIMLDDALNTKQEDLRRRMQHMHSALSKLMGEQ